MTTRAIWKGAIRLGESSIPVKFYAAVEEKGVHFRLLHKKDQTPVSQEMVHPETNGIVPAEGIRHGYETEDGRLVILSDQELQGIEPETSRDIEILAFLPGGAIDHRWHERPYFLGPDGEELAYFALIEALGGTDSEALARWVMRNKEYFGVLRLREGYPLMVTLRYAEEVVALSGVKIPAGREIDARELAMAEQLVAAMADTFDPRQYRDEFRQRVLELIAAKASGKVIPLRPAAPQKDAPDLQEALAASLRAAKERSRGRKN
jgi:DNA end-binding protein Ku